MSRGGSKPGEKAMEMTTSIEMSKEQADRDSFFAKLVAKCYTLFIVCGGFGISISLLNITKYIYIKYHFKHPLWMTASHMIASYLVCAAAIHIVNMVPNRRILTFREQVFVVAPFSLLGASSIACGNMALVYLYPSFHEMLQNSTPFWTVVSSIALKGSSFNFYAYLALIPVCTGGVLCAWGEPSKFAIVGLIISLFAAIFRAIRAIVQANLLNGQDPIDSITLLYYAAPFNLALFFVGSVLLEGASPWMEFPQLPTAGMMWICFAATCAAFYNLFAFLLVGHLGAVGSMVIGNLKTPTIIVSSMIIFGNECTPMQILGFCVAMFGAYSYNTYGKESMPQQPTKVPTGETVGAEMALSPAKSNGKYASDKDEEQDLV